MTSETDDPLDAVVRVRDESDVAMARQVARRLSTLAGLREGAVEAVATAVSEIARNIAVHAWTGEIRFTVLDEEDRTGILVMAVDHGPGIEDPDRAMEDGFSTRKSLGYGLAGAQRLMDEFKLASTLGEGTTVTMRKWATKSPGRAKWP